MRGSPGVTDIKGLNLLAHGWQQGGGGFIEPEISNSICKQSSANLSDKTPSSAQVWFGLIKLGRMIRDPEWVDSSTLTLHLFVASPDDSMSGATISPKPKETPTMDWTCGSNGFLDGFLGGFLGWISRKEHAWGEFLGGICWWIFAAHCYWNIFGRRWVSRFSPKNRSIHPGISSGKTRSPQAKPATLWHTP